MCRLGDWLCSINALIAEAPLGPSFSSRCNNEMPMLIMEYNRTRRTQDASRPCRHSEVHESDVVLVVCRSSEPWSHAPCPPCVIRSLGSLASLVTSGRHTFDLVRVPSLSLLFRTDPYGVITFQLLILLVLVRSMGSAHLQAEAVLRC